MPQKEGRGEWKEFNNVLCFSLNSLVESFVFTYLLPQLIYLNQEAFKKKRKKETKPQHSIGNVKYGGIGLDRQVWNPDCHYITLNKSLHLSALELLINYIFT